MLIELYLMATLDNYMFRPLLAIFRLSSRELRCKGYIVKHNCVYLMAILDNYMFRPLLAIFRHPHVYRTAHLPSTPSTIASFLLYLFLFCVVFISFLFLFLLISPLCRDLCTMCARMLIVRS